MTRGNDTARWVWYNTFMKSIFTEQINKELKHDFVYPFETNEGIFIIEIIARAKSWWQNLKGLRSFLKDDDITLNIDSKEIFTSNSNDKDVKAIWNGNELKGLAKTVLVAVKLKKGKHIITLNPDQSPSLESIKISELEEKDNNTIIYSPSDNNPPEKGDRRPWISCVFINLAIKELSVLAKADKQGRDDEDIKLLVNGKIEKNEDNKPHKDWLWCGKVLNGKEKEVVKAFNLEKGTHSIELWADNSPYLKKIEVTVLPDNDSGEYSEKTIKPYKYRGVFGNEDYNRYDAIIAETVAYWNNEFLKDTDPPDDTLDPNLVKAMIYQESRMGFDETAGINVMQVGKEGDPSVLTLTGELPEYWIHNGKLILLKYDAKVESIKDSVNWGVRWLYHKAQGSTNDKKRYWKPWREAVIKYGPPEEEYIVSVWDIYKKGIKKEKNGTIRLWSIVLFLISSLFLNGGVAYSLENRIRDQIMRGEREQLEDIKLAYSQDKNYFLAQVELEEDWWEELKVGRIKNQNIEWLRINKPPSEQAILSARFIDLEGFSDPVVEVYGLTHPWHGFLYIYEIKDDKLNLLFRTIAVDFNPDTRWAPDNYKKYGHGTCGEIFSNGKLTSEYKDVNKDGNLDLILSGTKEIICEEMDENYQNAREVTVDSTQIERKFLWDNDARVWSNNYVD